MPDVSRQRIGFIFKSRNVRENWPLQVVHSFLSKGPAPVTSDMAPCLRRKEISMQNHVHFKDSVQRETQVIDVPDFIVVIAVA